jgi:hypothetical protein
MLQIIYYTVCIYYLKSYIRGNLVKMNKNNKNNKTNKIKAQKALNLFESQNVRKVKIVRL